MATPSDRILEADILLACKPLQWFIDHPTIKLKVGQIVQVKDDPRYKRGDGVTSLSALPFYGLTTSVEWANIIGSPTDSTTLTAYLTGTYEQIVNKGVANGYASLDATGKLPANQLPVSAMEYKGQWNATTNIPVLINGTGDSGDVYQVSVAGTQNFGAGAISFVVGDWVVYNGTVWEKNTATGSVISVNGLTGTVILGTAEAEIMFGSTPGSAYTSEPAFKWITASKALNIGTATPLLSYDFNIAKAPSAGGIVAQSITNTTANGAVSLYQGQSATAHLATGYYGSSWGGNWAGTSVAKAASSFILSGNASDKPITITGSPIYNIVGQLAGAYGTRLDTVGYRIGVLSGLHTINTSTFEVEGGFKYNNISSTSKTFDVPGPFNGSIAWVSNASATTLTVNCDTTTLQSRATQVQTTEILKVSRIENQVGASLAMTNYICANGAGALDAGGYMRFSLSGTDNANIAADTHKIAYVWERAQTNNTTDRDSAFIFSTMLDNSLGERMRIGSTGVKVGTATPTSTYLLSNIILSNSTGNSLYSAFNSSTSGSTGFIFGQNDNSISIFNRFGTAFAGNYTGSSIAQADSMKVQSGSGFDKALIIAGTPIIGIIGISSTNYGHRLDASGFRIGLLSTLHTANTSGTPFSINGEFTCSVTATDNDFKIIKPGDATKSSRLVAGVTSHVIMANSGGCFVDASTGVMMFRTYTASDITVRVNTTTDRMIFGGATATVTVGASTQLVLAAGVAAKASLNIPSGVAPTTPAAGDIYNNGGVLTVQTLNGTGARMVQAAADGALTATSEILDQEITDATTITNLTTGANWTGIGYTGPAITGTFKGQWYMQDGTYMFIATADNVWRRLAWA